MHTNADVSELASFVEVCSGSAGEEEFNMIRLSCLHSVGTNFAALIYGLPDNANFDVFDERCKTVENLLEHNPKLGESLVSIKPRSFQYTPVSCNFFNLCYVCMHFCAQGILDGLTTHREEVL